ncbi:MAG: HAD family hydrolase [Planctomycetota bacterium]|nr:HAD family hydrolase [Planctomycetota bacterium]
MVSAVGTGKYKLLAVDVDGTLMNHGVMDDADVDSLHEATHAGIVVTLCTGRSWEETRNLWQDLRLPAPHGPVVCAGGALIVEPDTGRTLYSRTFDKTTAQELTQQMQRMGYPVMALVDAWREGFDYFLVGRYDDRPLYQNFINATPRRIRQVDRLDCDGYPRPLRISALEEPGAGRPAVEVLKRHFAGRIEIQDIYLSHRDVDIVEAFSAGTDKFTAIQYVGQGYRIAPSAFAAIGDDNNDLAMLRGSGISGTPADAPDELRKTAKMILSPRGSCPVSEFVDAVLNS